MITFECSIVHCKKTERGVLCARWRPGRAAAVRISDMSESESTNGSGEHNALLGLGLLSAIAGPPAALAACGGGKWRIVDLQQIPGRGHA